MKGKKKKKIQYPCPYEKKKEEEEKKRIIFNRNHISSRESLQKTQSSGHFFTHSTRRRSLPPWTILHPTLLRLPFLSPAS